MGLAGAGNGLPGGAGVGPLTTNRGRELDKTDHVVLLIRAWNAFVAGRQTVASAGDQEPVEPEKVGAAA